MRARRMSSLRRKSPFTSLCLIFRSCYSYANVFHFLFLPSPDIKNFFRLLLGKMNFILMRKFIQNFFLPRALQLYRSSTEKLILHIVRANRECKNSIMKLTLNTSKHRKSVTINKTIRYFLSRPDIICFFRAFFFFF